MPDLALAGELVIVVGCFLSQFVNHSGRVITGLCSVLYRDRVVKAPIDRGPRILARSAL